MAGSTERTDANGKRAPRDRRTKNYWEPMFAPEQLDGYAEHDWIFNHNKKPFRSIFYGNKFPTGFKKVIEKIAFEECDFSGYLPDYLTFKECDFNNCDFGLSTWKNAKFTNCTFTKTSFSMTTFSNCEFRSCKWDTIGLSGNMTNLQGTIITNPSKFIDAAYSGTNPNKKLPSGDPAHQRARLESTKATVARTLAATLTIVGDEATYYEAIATKTKQSIRADMHEAIFNFRKERNIFKECYLLAKVPFLLIEFMLIFLAGWMNNWGSSIAKPAIIGAIIMIFFSYVYLEVGLRADLKQAIITSIEVTLLAGYTKHANTDLPLWEQSILTANMILGLAWYAVLVPTIVNRIRP